jgi:hypothetical protein
MSEGEKTKQTTKEKASRQTHTQETTTKLTKKNTNGSVQCDHMGKKAKNQRSRFLQTYGNKNILHS